MTSDSQGEFKAYVFFGTLENKTIVDAAQVQRYKQGLASDVMKNILEDFGGGNETLVSENWIDTTHPFDLQFDPASSILDIYDTAFVNNFTSATGSTGDSVFNILKADGDIFDRQDPKYVLEPINRKFLDLYSSLRGQSVSDLTDTVIEGIMESGGRFIP